jgi:Dpy-30 motif
MVKERPPNPIEFLASYLLQHDPQRITDTTVAGGTAGNSVPSSLPLPGSTR